MISLSGAERYWKGGCDDMIKMRRKKYLVNKPVQYRYMGLVVVPLIALLAGLYYLIYYSVFTEMLIPEAVTTTLLPAMKKVNIVALIGVPIILAAILRIALIYSNRIIGPIPRIERELDRVLAGDKSVRIKTRNNDELNSFINKINAVLERMERQGA
jgi:methyl-accepting chemotaxis protein